MELEHVDIIEAPLVTVYKLVRDDLPKVAAYLPNIEKIVRLEYEKKSEAQIKIVNHWFAKVDVPGLVKKFVSDDLFSWKDTALWDDEKHSVAYELQSFFANDLFTARGINSFSEKGAGKTQLKLKCSIEIHPEKIPGIPKLMVRSVQPAFEKLIEKMLQPNMTSLGEGLKSYLKATTN